VVIRIHDTNDRAIRGCVFSLEREARFFSATPEHQLTNASAHGVDGNHGLTIWLKVFVQRLHYQQFATFQRVVFDGCDHRTYYPGKLHDFYA
jgi:hypothetical protein